MTTIELTLSLEEQVIDKIKGLAAEQGVSLSKFVEKHLEKASAEMDEKTKKAEAAEWVKSLRLSDKPTPDFDNKEEYRQHIIEKYSK